MAERRVFLPGEGWISAEAFQDIYHNHPQKLPAEMDFEQVHELMDLIESEQALTDKHSSLAEENGDPAVSEDLTEKRGYLIKTDDTGNLAKISDDPAKALTQSAPAIGTPTEPQNQP